MCQEFMSKPPKEIDGAKVIEWSWSGDRPFGVIYYDCGKIASEIFGLAICKYRDSEVVYRFSCDANWEAEQDSEYCSAVDAKEHLPDQYRNVDAVWQKMS
uniref:hypothetical protein n=1 Tax=Microbulbifer agarilyticus TaxID=260552 RepID=UPI00025582F0|nr:hypothetical protein [Microbulbifer agarilyticus]